MIDRTDQVSTHLTNAPIVCVQCGSHDLQLVEYNYGGALILPKYYGQYPHKLQLTEPTISTRYLCNAKHCDHTKHTVYTYPIDGVEACRSHWPYRRARIVLQGPIL